MWYRALDRRFEKPEGLFFLTQVVQPGRAPGLPAGLQQKFAAAAGSHTKKFLGRRTRCHTVCYLG